MMMITNGPTPQPNRLYTAHKRALGNVENMKRVCKLLVKYASHPSSSVTTHLKITPLSLKKTGIEDWPLKSLFQKSETYYK